MRLESSSRSFQMTARKTSISPDFPFRNTIRYFDSDQMLEESKSLSKRKLQVEHSGGRESNVQRKQTQKRQISNFLPDKHFFSSISLSFCFFSTQVCSHERGERACFAGGSARKSRAKRASCARFARAKRARSIYTMVGGLLRRERHSRLPRDGEICLIELRAALMLKTQVGA